MAEKLNLLESAIMSEIAKYNEKKYPFIRNHIQCLLVKSRENTGVGLYISFIYKKQYRENPNINHLSLSSNRTLELDTLEYGLSYELNITDGKIDFLELVTNGEDWDGTYNEFKFIE